MTSPVASHECVSPIDTSRIREDAQDKIIAALVNAAFVEDDAAQPEVAHAIRMEATKMAKRWGLSQVSGLPGTWPRGKKVPDYD